MAECPQQLPNDEDSLPFTPEYDVECEGGPDSKLRFETCKKNPGHPNFIQAKQFKKEDIPEPYRTDYCWDRVQDRIKRTVRIVVKYVSPRRPDNYLHNDIRGKYTTLYGTGHLYRKVKRVKDKPCKCLDCRMTGDPKIGYLKVKVETAQHVVFDESEALHTVVEVGYDSDERNDVIKLYGVRALNNTDKKWLDLDITWLRCVTHEVGLYEKLDFSVTSSNKPLHLFPVLPLIVSHPHGRSKHITFGTKVYDVFKPVTSSSPTDPPITRSVEGRKCRLPINHSTTSLDVFQQLVECDTTPCVPGVVYRVREGVTVSSYRLDARYWDMLGKLGDDLCGFVKFHPDVEFRWSSGNDIHSFPDVEFEMVTGDRDLIENNPHLSYHEYNTDTCPGSSGACVDGGVILFPHAGCSNDNRMNRTGRFTYTPEEEDTKTKTTCCSCTLI